MMDPKEKEIILATKKYAKDDPAKSWFYVLTTLLCLIGTIAISVSALPLFIRIIASVIIGLLLVRMFVIYHDFLHKTILKGNKIARLLFTFYGFYTLNPPSIWKRSHDHHHKHNSKLYTSSIGSFPIVTKEKFLNAQKSERFAYLFIRHPLTIAAGYIFAFTYGMCLLSLTRNPRKHWDSFVALLFHYGMGFMYFYFFGWTGLLLAFLIPAIISSAIGSYLFYAQHNFPGTAFKDKENWSYYKAAMESSSFMVMSPIMNWFTGNIGYHHIHHLNALIPFYRLPEVHQAFQLFQDKAKKTSLHPKDIIACLRLKVWDPHQNRMISLQEIG